MNFQNINTLKIELDSYRPLPQETVKSIHDDLIIKWTYNSNAIEGNTLTVYETKVVLEDGVTIGGKPLREHFEALNHKEAILYIEDIANSSLELSESVIRSIHQLILKNIDDTNAGKYRTQNVLISGANHTPIDYLQVSTEMEKFIEWYKSSKELHPIERASLLHSKFVNIHPFIDGNGRTARLLLNLELIKCGFPPIIIKTEERFKYYEFLDRCAVENDFTPFIEMIIKYSSERLEEILNLVAHK